MNFPRGNVLLKPTDLSVEDLRIKLTNLQNHGFNGYVKVTISETSYFIFLLEGKIRAVVELSSATPKLISALLLYHRVRKAVCTIESYVFAPELVEVLSQFYAFQEKHVDHQVRKREFNKILAALDSEKITGILEVRSSSATDSTFMLLSEGRIMTDNFLNSYGQIITGPDQVSQTLELLSEEGGVVNAHGETREQISWKGKEMAETLSQYRELELLVESGGLFGGGNVIRVDESLLKEWSRGKPVQKIEIFAHHGSPESFKVAGKKGLGTKISLASSIQKKLGLSKDEPVLVRPVE